MTVVVLQRQEQELQLPTVMYLTKLARGRQVRHELQRGLGPGQYHPRAVHS